MWGRAGDICHVSVAKLRSSLPACVQNILYIVTRSLGELRVIVGYANDSDDHQVPTVDDTKPLLEVIGFHNFRPGKRDGSEATSISKRGKACSDSGNLTLFFSFESRKRVSSPARSSG